MEKKRKIARAVFGQEGVKIYYEDGGSKFVSNAIQSRPALKRGSLQAHRFRGPGSVAPSFRGRLGKRRPR